MIELVHNLIEWTVHWARTPQGPIVLFIIAFFESSCFPVPPDLLLIALCLLNPKASLIYSSICLVGSVLGGCFGYLIGIKGGYPILKRFVKEEKIKMAHSYFEKYEAWAIFIAAFTPIPYKVFTIAAGVFYINFFRFVIASIFGRGGRFFLVGILFMLFGEEIKPLMKKYFELFTLSFTILLIGGFLAMKYLKPKNKSLPQINTD